MSEDKRRKCLGPVDPIEPMLNRSRGLNKGVLPLRCGTYLEAVRLEVDNLYGMARQWCRGHMWLVCAGFVRRLHTWSQKPILWDMAQKP